MADEKILVEALGSSDFKVSAQEKRQTDLEEKKVAVENKQQFGEETNLEALNANKTNDQKSLLLIFKNMSAEQRQKVIDLLKQNGLGDPLTKEKIIQNAFTVDKTIRDNVK